MRSVFVRGVPLACDLDTFRPLGGGFARDAQHAYLDGEILPGADPRTLRHVRGRYACDAQRVWAGTRELDAVPATFRLIDEVLDYATDGVAVFHHGHRLEPVVDARRFRVIDEAFISDDVKVYAYADGRVTEPTELPVEFAKFRALGGGYGTDGNVLVFHAAVLDGVRPETARVLTENLLVAGPFLFVGNEPVQADGHTFQLLEVAGRATSYARDRDHVYLAQPRSVRRLDFDRATFEALGGAYGRDHESVTWWGARFDAGAPFEVLSADCGRDLHRVYFDGAVFEDADRDSFRVLDPEYSVDQHHVFRRAAYFSDYVDGFSVDVLEHADPRTFVVLSQGYTRDARHVFAGATRLDATPDTFVNVGGPFFSDGHRVWCEGEELIGVHAASFVHLGDLYARAELSPRADVRVLDAGLATDDTETWFHGHPLPIRGAVQSLGHGFLRTGNAACFFDLQTESRKVPEFLPAGRVLEDVDASRARVLSPNHLTDGQRVFYRSIRLEGLDASSARALSEFHLTDGAVVFAGPARLDADAATFEPLVGEYVNARSYSFDARRPGYYARDRRQLYAGAHPLSLPSGYVSDEQRLLLAALSPERFVALNQAFGTDGRWVFSFTSCAVLPQADPATFVTLPGHHARDAFHGFHATRERALLSLEGHDFVVLGFGFARCGARVFHEEHELLVDATAFEVFGDGYATDGLQVFDGSSLLQGADPASFRVLGPGVAFDSRTVFFRESRARTAIQSAPELLGHGYWRNRGAIWWEATPLNADVATFEVLTESYARDAAHVFHRDRTLR
jgi:hypothetical protein